MIRIPKAVNTVLDLLAGHWQRVAIVAALLAVVALIAVRGPSVGLAVLGCIVSLIAGTWWPQKQVRQLRAENADLERDKGRLAHVNRILAAQVDTDQQPTKRMHFVGFEDRSSLRGGDT